jgi:hypothetical protein
VVGVIAPGQPPDLDEPQTHAVHPEISPNSADWSGSSPYSTVSGGSTEIVMSDSSASNSLGIVPDTRTW